MECDPEVSLISQNQLIVFVHRERLKNREYLRFVTSRGIYQLIDPIHTEGRGRGNILLMALYQKTRENLRPCGCPRPYPQILRYLLKPFSNRYTSPLRLQFVVIKRLQGNHLVIPCFGLLQEPLIITKNGIKIGFLGYCEFETDYKTKNCSEMRLLFNSGPAIYQDAIATRDVKKLKEVVLLTMLKTTTRHLLKEAQ